MEDSASQPAILGRTDSLRWPRFATTKERLREVSPSDTEILERLKRKDEQAFLTLYDLHGIAVYRFLMHMTGSLTSAEELTQEVFVVILVAICKGEIGRFDPNKGTFEGYLLGIARNLARAERRKTGRMVSLSDTQETPEWERLVSVVLQEDEVWNIEAEMIRRSEVEVLYRAIRDLPVHYREAVVLCGLQSRSYREAAGLLQCSEGTVASRMNRARSLLAGRLREAAQSKANLSAI
jgi:RNA polymerase sigma-70 factor (ECF subfamily)